METLNVPLILVERDHGTPPPRLGHLCRPEISLNNPVNHLTPGMVNRYRFRTKQYEEFTSTQNIRAMIVSMIERYATDVTQDQGVMKDELGFTLAHFSCLAYSGDWESDEPFIFDGKAQQVIFVKDPEDHEWFYPLSIRPRDILYMGDVNSMRFDSSIHSNYIIERDMSQMSIIAVKDIIRGEHVKDPVVVTLKGREHAWRGHFEHSMRKIHVWKVSWGLLEEPWPWNIEENLH
ncbi:hypothetical protein BC332_25537 [Capsicum chinense]|nr:hypothetical protein BC332_25537 [Capsicum chinense]